MWKKGIMDSGDVKTIFLCHLVIKIFFLFYIHFSLSLFFLFSFNFFEMTMDDEQQDQIIETKEYPVIVSIDFGE